MTLSHEDLLLLILSDGRWHSLHEILRRHPMMVHSRASALRIKRGYNIEHRCVGKGATGSEYRWLSLSGRAGPRAGAHVGSPAGDRMTPSECGYRDSARPLSDQPLTEGATLSRASLGDESPQVDHKPGALSVSDWLLTPEGDGKSGLHGGSFSPSDVSGPVSPGAAVGLADSPPATAAPAAHYWAASSTGEEEETASAAGQLSLTEEAA